MRRVALGAGLAYGTMVLGIMGLKAWVKRIELGEEEERIIEAIGMRGNGEVVAE